MGKSQTNAPKILWWDGARNVHVNKIFLSVCNVFFVLLEVFEWMNEMVGIFAWTDIVLVAMLHKLIHSCNFFSTDRIFGVLHIKCTVFNQSALLPHQNLQSIVLVGTATIFNESFCLKCLKKWKVLFAKYCFGCHVRQAIFK